MALCADEADLAKAIDNVLEPVELRPLLEGPSAIPKNTPVMSSPQVLVMLPPSHPISIVIRIIEL